MIDKCNCKYHGFCPTFNKIVTYKDWEWCQNTTLEERKQYYDILQKAPPPQEDELESFKKRYDGDPKLLYLHYLMLDKRFNYCSKAHEYQIDKNRKIDSYIQNQAKTIKNFDNIEILSLGHSQKQFDTIQDRSYIKKVNLNNINVGKYSDNKWAEARAFILDIFSDKSEWIGFTTASWNMKYESFCKIDSFHEWTTSQILLNSKPEDNVVLCADIFCSCIWFESIDNILFSFFRDNGSMIGNKFLKMVGLKQNLHMKVPFSNIFICHKSIWMQYKKYLDENNIFDKLDEFIDKYAKKYINDKLTNYSLVKINGYFVEMLTCFWFASHPEFLYLPNAQRRIGWYSEQEIQRRK